MQIGIKPRSPLGFEHFARIPCKMRCLPFNLKQQGSALATEGLQHEGTRIGSRARRRRVQLVHTALTRPQSRTKGGKTENPFAVPSAYLSSLPRFFVFHRAKRARWLMESQCWKHACLQSRRCFSFFEQNSRGPTTVLYQ